MKNIVLKNGWHFNLIWSVGSLRQWEVLPRWRVQSVPTSNDSFELGMGFAWLIFWLHINARKERR